MRAFFAVVVLAVVVSSSGCAGTSGSDGANGADGNDGASGFNTLVAVTDADPGSCPAGGRKIETGLDDGAGGGIARDGLLQAGEIDGTSFVCNGTNGFSSLIRVTDASTGDCPAGGRIIETGLDDGGGSDGIAYDASLQSGEIDSTSIVCSGASSNGFTSLVSVSDAAVADCPAGGKRIEAGLDDGAGGGVARDGILQGGEVDTTSNVCNGTDGTNFPTPPACDGAWQVLQWDGVDYLCADVRTFGPSLGMANGFELIDSWGYGWDGVTRVARSWSQASADCQGSGGRLPTTTELWRVNHLSGAGDVGDVNAVEYLWSAIPFDGVATPTPYYAFRLSDGGHTNYAETTLRPYRCVWPDRAVGRFDGNQCYGPPGAECWRPAIGDQRYNFDKYDRAPISTAAAHRECAFYHAHLATELALHEAVAGGLPHGNTVPSGGGWLTTSDQQGYNGVNFMVGLVIWNGVDATFSDYYPTFATWGYSANGVERPYRCVGFATDHLPNPQAVADQHVAASTTLLKSTTGDLPAASWIMAAAGCRASGGHLPSTRDYIELVQQGLPNGSNVHLWTAEHENGAYVGVVKWPGAKPLFDGTWSTYSTWAPHAGTPIPYRCVWYPVDGGYVAPAETDCNGGCSAQSVTVGGVTTTTWSDTFDRSPTATYDAAVRSCLAAGGHLGTYRDMAELIRGGLPNGSNQYLWTSDLTSYQTTKAIRWNGVETGFSSTEGTHASEVARNTAALRPFRCVWTNEIRW